MARQASIQKELKKIKTCDYYRKKRKLLKEKLCELQIDAGENFEEIQEVYAKFRSLPRNASPTRIRNRCQITGRSRGYYRRFGLERNMVRKLAMQGEIPGVVKSSW